VALDPATGDLYVSDGYGNSRVHKYSPDGKLLFSWGQSGTDPGEFNIVHSIATDNAGYVYMADRENHRVQVFDSRGRFETQWVNMHRPCVIYVSDDQDVYVGEMGSGMNVNRELPNIGPRLSVFNTSGERYARVGHLGLRDRDGAVLRAPRHLRGLARGHLRRGGGLDQRQQFGTARRRDTQLSEAGLAAWTV
jgi:DNA-binding beta-propeller fold protein YncE